ncbi:MAG: hypothetical protein ACJATF_003462, partial [Flavobacteriales bacterium]
LTILLFSQCKDKSTASNNQPSFPNKVSLRMSTATASVYKNLLNKEKTLNPIARMCAESGGYKKDEWDALNECSWAVEKYQISRHPTVASRTGGQLLVEVGDSLLTLTHKADEYYQFVDYITKSKHLVIRVLRPLACPEYWLIGMGAKKGKTVLSGQPVFNGDKNAFMLSGSSSNRKINCPTAVGYWELKDGVFYERTTQKVKGGVQDLYWYTGGTWLGAAGEKVLEVVVFGE